VPAGAERGSDGRRFYCAITTAGLILMTKAATTNGALVGMTPIRFVTKREGYDPGY